MGAAVAAAVIRMRENDVIDDFRRAGALSPATAQSLDGIGVDDSLALRRLHNRAVIRESGPRQFYLDEEVWAAVRRTRHRLVRVLLTVVVIVSLGIYFGLITTR